MSDYITVKRYEVADYARWNAFLHDSVNPLFMFNRNYMDYHKDRFADHSLMFFDDNKMVAILPLNEQGSTLYSHGGLTYGGFIIGKTAKQHTINACLEVLMNYASENGYFNIMIKTIPHIYHEQPAEEEIYALFRKGAIIEELAASTVVNLRNPIKMSKGRKAQVRRARREGVTVREVTEKIYFDEFIDMENAVLEERYKTQAVHSADELFMLHERFPDEIHLYGAFYTDKLIAGTVIYEYGQAIHTQYMATNEKAKEIGGLDLLISTIMTQYCQSKLWLDFGISTENGGKYLNEGLISQKEGFGGRTNIYLVWKLKIPNVM